MDVPGAQSKTRSYRCGLLVRRDDWIRTSDPLHPMQVRYRAALRPEVCLEPIPLSYTEIVQFQGVQR